MSAWLDYRSGGTRHNQFGLQNVKKIHFDFYVGSGMRLKFIPKSFGNAN